VAKRRMRRNPYATKDIEKLISRYKELGKERTRLSNEIERVLKEKRKMDSYASQLSKTFGKIQDEYYDIDDFLRKEGIV